MGQGDATTAALIAQLMGTGTSTLMGVSASREEERFRRQQLGFNARLAEMQAEDAVARGSEEEARHRRGVRQLAGAQRAAQAAQGVETGTGSAADVVGETERLGAEDALRIRANAFREAWGYRAQAVDLGTQSRYARLAGRNQRRSTLLQGGMTAAQQYALFRAEEQRRASPGGGASRPRAGPSLRGGFRQETGY